LSKTAEELRREVLRQLAQEELLQGLSTEERLRGLTVEEIYQGLSEEVRRQVLEIVKHRDSELHAPGHDAFPDVPPERRPRHIAVIMDGNGRWAQRQGLPRIEGHRRGVASVRNTVEECARLGIEQLTLYCLSSENWKRPQSELDFLMHLLEQYMIEERSVIMRQNIVVSIIGRREGIPDQVQREMDKTIALSASNRGTRLCLAINYGGRAEMVDAVRRIAADVKGSRLAPEAIDEATIASYLYTSGMPDPDLLIRTAGEMRISNFLLWQISYAELWVTDLCWPEFGIEQLHQAICEYASRDRRFGGLL
jgi:undecaprenyl diphosphate synthase